MTSSSLDPPIFSPPDISSLYRRLKASDQIFALYVGATPLVPYMVHSGELTLIAIQCL